MVRSAPPDEEKIVTSQTREPCQANNCPRGGRVIGRLGGKKVAYCGHHRKNGERVFNFLINSVFHFKLTDFLKETKHDLFMANNPELCKDCNDRLEAYIHVMIGKLDEVQDWHEKAK